MKRQALRNQLDSLFLLPAIESHNTSPSEQSDNALANPTGHEIDHNRRAFSILISNSDFFLDGNNNCEAN